LILSQRGKDHHLFKGLDLPSWTAWAEDFVAEEEIDASWSSIKRAVAECEGGRAPAALRSKRAVPSNKLLRQRIAHAALLGLELKHAFDEGLDHEDALGQLRDLGITKDDILGELKRLGFMEVPDFVTEHTHSPFSGSIRTALSRRRR
jgi:RNA-binding protein YlmH